MSYLSSEMGSYLTREQTRALEAEFGEMQFIQLMALATHAAGSYTARHIALEYAHTMRTLEEMSHSLSPAAQETLRRMQADYSTFSTDNMHQTYRQLLTRFTEIIANPQPRTPPRASSGQPPILSRASPGDTLRRRSS